MFAWCIVTVLFILGVYICTSAQFHHPRNHMYVLSNSIWCFRGKVRPEVTCYSLKWRTCHTQFPLRVRLSHFAPPSGMWDVSMAVVPVSRTTSVCSSLVRWASPNITPASCLMCYFKLLWNMRITIIWDVSWAMFIWLCSSEPLPSCGVPHHDLLWLCCGLGCVSSRLFAE